MTDPTIAEAEAQRAAIVADIRAFADWLEANPWAPPPTILNTSEHLNGIGDPNPAATLARLRELVKRFGGEVDESLTDRTRGTLMVGRVEYKLLAWHTAGRPGDVDPRDAELARLRAEVAELKAKPADRAGFEFSREMAPEDGDLTQPGRVEPHTGGVTAGGLVDETEAEPVKIRHYHDPSSDVLLACNILAVAVPVGEWITPDRKRVTCPGCVPLIVELAHAEALDADVRRAKAEIIANLREGEHGRITNLGLARFLAERENKRRGLVDEADGHFYIGDGFRGCDELLAGKVRCGAGRDQHPLARPIPATDPDDLPCQPPVHMAYALGGTFCELPEGSDAKRSLVWREVTCQACTDAVTE